MPMLMRGSAVRCGETETRKTIGLFIFGNFYGALRSPNTDASFLSPVARSLGRAKIAHFTQSSFFKTAIAVLRSPPLR